MNRFFKILVLGSLCCIFHAASAAPTAVPPNITQLKAANAQALAENGLILQVDAARAAKDWPKAEGLLQKLTAMNPSRWQYAQALGDAELAQGKYPEALKAYEAALQGAAADKKQDRKSMAVIYSGEGNAYLKLKRDDEAIKAYTQAATLSDNPGTAWFNVCAVEYNLGQTDPALAACDKAIAADPAKADAYFIKGSVLMGNSTVDAGGKTVAPPGTVEALQMYLKLAPTGGHASDVQQMLDYINGKN